MHFETWQLLFLAALGILAGALNVIAGGGSLLTLPVMIFMGLPEAVANGSNRVAILAQNITAVSGFEKKGLSDFRLSLTLALAAIPGAVIGAHTGALIRGELFNRILAAIMIAVMIMMAAQKPSKKPRHAALSSHASTPLAISPHRLFWGHIGMIGVGFYGGFIQAGVGFLFMALLSNVMKLDLVRVNMHKVFVVASFTLAALVVFLVHGKVWWIPGLCLAVGNSLGGWIGSQLSISKGETFIRRILYIAILVMAAKLMFG